MMSRTDVVLCCIPKGGSGKTTLATSLAITLARRGRRTLLVDLDYQGNATSVMIGGVRDPGRTIGTQLIRAAQGISFDPAAGLERDVVVPGLDLFASDEVSSNIAGSALGGMPGRKGEEMLSVVLSGLHDYDTVVIDLCPKLIDPFVSSALRVGTSVLIPVVPEAWAVAGIIPMLGQVNAYQSVNPLLGVAGIVPSRVPSNRRAARDAVSALDSAGVHVFRSIVKETTEVNAAHNHGIPAVVYSRRVARDYEAVTDEYLALRER